MVMNGLKIPLDFSSIDNFYNNNQINVKDRGDNVEESIKDSINGFIKLLVSSPNGSFKPNVQFGFTLNNCYFENTNSKDEIKGKKIGGKSDNSGNFAKDLEKAIKQFEPRLQNLEIKTDFEKKLSKITISINGNLIESKKEYKQELEFYIWRNNETIRRV